MMRAFTADAGVSLTLTSAGMIYPGYRGPLVMAQNPWIRSAPSNGIRLGSHTSRTGKQPHLYRLKRWAHQPKKN
jgi:hypothetical protein